MRQKYMGFIMKIKIGFAMFALALLAPPVFAADAHSHKASKVVVGVESLSPELRGLLKNEMRELQKGMMLIIPSYVSGDWGEIESIARKMKNSYILKQSLSDKQVNELHTTLPEAFVKLDQNFHYLAGMLGHAAKNKKPELVGFYFSKVSESCVSCHSQFASHRFPAFKSKLTTHHHQH